MGLQIPQCHAPVGRDPQARGIGYFKSWSAGLHAALWFTQIDWSGLLGQLYPEFLKPLHSLLIVFHIIIFSLKQGNLEPYWEHLLTLNSVITKLGSW